MATARTAFGITYYSYSLHDWRKLRTPHDIPRSHWPILQRSGNYEPANRIDRRAGAIPQLGGVDHIGAGFEDRIGLDTGAELLTEYGLNPGNRRASWHAAGDSDTICLLAPPDTRPWVQGSPHHPVDMNSVALGYEDGIQSTNWDALPEPKRTAHLRMRAAWWALWFGYLGWPLIYTPDQWRVYELARQGRSWGLTQHGDIEPNTRTDAGYVWRGGRRVNTFPYDELLPMIRQEMGIRAGGAVSTPGLPVSTEYVRTLQGVLNEYGHNLDLDGSFGPLTEAAAEQVAADTGYTGDIKDAAALTKHLEETMSKIDQVLDRLTDIDNTVRAQPGKVLGTRLPGADNARVDEVLVANWRNGRAALAAIGSGGPVDTAALADALRDDIVAAVRESGGAATPEQIVDHLVARLSKEA